MKNVSHRNAPGAMSAIALTVKPVRPSVDGGFAAGDAGDIRCSFLVARRPRAQAWLSANSQTSNKWSVRTSAARPDGVRLFDRDDEYASVPPLAGPRGFNHGP